MTLLTFGLVDELDGLGVVTGFSTRQQGDDENKLKVTTNIHSFKGTRSKQRGIKLRLVFIAGLSAASLTRYAR
jgi:hypothetical protein